MAAAPKNGSQAAGSKATGSKATGSKATGSQATGSKAAGGRRAVLIASGDLREEANRVCWPAQQAMEQALAKAFAAAGCPPYGCIGLGTRRR